MAELGIIGLTPYGAVKGGRAVPFATEGTEHASNDCSCCGDGVIISVTFAGGEAIHKRC